MELFLLLPLLMVFIGGSVYGVYYLMLIMNVPQPFVWIVPLIVLGVFIILFVKHSWKIIWE